MEFSVAGHTLVLSQTHAEAWSWADGAGVVAVPRLWKPAFLETVSLLWELQGLFTLYTLSSCSASSHLVLSLLL